jgi:hypothetical protein
VFCSITVRETIMCQIGRTFFNNLDGMNVKISTPLTSAKWDEVSYPKPSTYSKKFDPSYMINNSTAMVSEFFKYKSRTENRSKVVGSLIRRGADKPSSPPVDLSWRGARWLEGGNYPENAS